MKVYISQWENDEGEYGIEGVFYTLDAAHDSLSWLEGAPYCEGFVEEWKVRDE